MLRSAVFGAVLGATFFLLISGSLRFLSRSVLDTHGAFLPAHRWVGALLYPLFVGVSVWHVARMAGRWFAVLVFAAQVLPIVALATFAPPMFALALGIGLCVPLAVLFGRLAPTEYRRNQIAGFVTFASIFATLFSGFTLGVLGPEALAGDPLSWEGFGWVHRVTAICCVASLLLHALWRPSTARVGSTRASPRVSARMLVVAAAVLSLPAIGPIRVCLDAARIAARTGAHPAAARTIHLAAMGGEASPPPLPAERWHTVGATCGAGGCHQALVEQWGVSAHRFSAVNLPYRKVVELLASEEGERATVFCARCHDPVGVMLGLSDLDSGPFASEIRAEGISCAVCHLTTGVDEPAANGSLVLSLDEDPPGASDDPRRLLARGLVNHSETYGLPHLEGQGARHRPCGACHRIVTPSALNGGAELVQEDTYTGFLDLDPSAGAPTCDVCHLTLHRYEDPVHARPDHRVFGTLTMLAGIAPPGVLPPERLASFDASALAWRLTGLPYTRYDQAYTTAVAGPQIGAIAKFLTGDRPIALDLEVNRDRAPRDQLRIHVVTKNRTGAHSLPTGPLALNDVWLEVVVSDARGGIVFQSGTLDERGRVPPGTSRLGGTLIDEHGDPITHDRLWRAVAVRDARLIPPAGSVEDLLTVPIPIGAAGPLRVEVRWRYRRYQPDFAEWVFGSAAAVPIVDLGARAAEIGL